MSWVIEFKLNLKKRLNKTLNFKLEKIKFFNLN